MAAAEKPAMSENQAAKTGNHDGSDALVAQLPKMPLLGGIAAGELTQSGSVKKGQGGFLFTMAQPLIKLEASCFARRWQAYSWHANA